MRPDDFSYHLPRELIAQEAVKPKDHSRLLVLKKGIIEHRHFYDLPDYFEKGDVLVINETKVSRAKLVGKKETGSPIEIILEKKIDSLKYECRIRGNRIRKGARYLFGDDLSCEVVDAEKDLFTIAFSKPLTKKMVDEAFELPTPPYIKNRLHNDSEYQTVYAKKEGSLAAPTAGLHFTPELLKKLEDKGVKIAKVCLHVGFGTFLHITGEIESHKMHEEYFEISREAADVVNNRMGKLVAVGTTTVRTLETAAQEDGRIRPLSGMTGIFIYPGYKFKTKMDMMITNFHLPESTLLMLVCAYAGNDKIFAAYQEAIKEKYRFYSLGDAMLIVI